MSFELIALLASILVNLTLGLMSFRRNPRSATHRLFAALSIVITFWATANYLSVRASTETATLLWIRVVMTFATANSVLFFLLMHTFPRATFSLSKRILVIIAIITVITMGVSLSPYVFTSIDGTGTSATPIPGIGMALFVPVGILTIPLGLFFMVRNNIRARGREKLQHRYLLLGTTIMFTLILGLVFFPVVLANSSYFVRYSAEFTLPFVIATSYAIIRYRLMDIRAVIFRAVGFSALTGGFFIIYGLLIYGLMMYLARYDLSSIQQAVVGTVSVAIAMPAFHYFRLNLRKVTDKFLFQNRVDYRKALVKIGEDLSGTIKINDVTDTVLAAMRDIIRSKKTIIFLQEPDGKELIPHATDGANNFHVTIPHDHVLLQHLRHAVGPLVKDELALLKEQERSPRHAEELKEVDNALAWLDASVVLPLIVSKKITGIIVLGDKLSGEPYLQDDTNFLAALAPQAATALENARLYQESLEFSEKLKVEVERATHELAVANEQLRDLDKAKSEFLSVASHQLYTPLTALRGYLSMIQEGDYGKTPPKQRPIMNILEKSAERLISLIKNLLDISRIESGRLELDLEAVNLALMIKELVRDLMPNAKQKDLKLTFEAPKKPLPRVVADRQRLRQVMLNFIDNAIKYTKQGQIDVTLRQLDSELIFSVTDTGKGLTQQEIGKLFHKFTRVGGPDRFRTEGTGLGLYVAKQIVQEHRGEVNVDSPGTGHGSTFSMRLPIEGSRNSLKLGEKATVAIKATG